MQRAASSLQSSSSQGGASRQPRHDRPCLLPLLGMSTPCTRALRMSSGPSDGTLLSRPQAHSDETPATALTSTATQSDETPATALTSTAYKSDETYSSELAMIDGKPGSLCQHHERNASAASSEQVIASSTERRPRRALFAAQRPVSLASGRAATSLASASTCPPPTCPFWPLT